MNRQPLVKGVRFEQHHDGLGLATGSPRISWSFEAGPTTISNWTQAGYEVEIVGPGVTESKYYNITSSQSILVPWPGKALRSREIALVRIRVHGTSSSQEQSETINAMEWSEWSAWAKVEVAFLLKDDWSATTVVPSATFSNVTEDGSLRPIRFRKTFRRPDGVVSRARLYATALGVYQVHINGKRVGDHVMSPGWTSYKHRLQYQTYDVTELIGESVDIVFEAEVAAGWYASSLGWAGGRRCRFGDTLGFLAQLEIYLDNAHDCFRIETDESWFSATSATVQSEIYNGETYDTRLQPHDWASIAGTSVSWAPVITRPLPAAELVSPQAPPIRVTGEIKPVAIFKTPSKKTIIDFGQNLVGKLHVRYLHKPEGHKIRFSHAEVMEDGELGTRPLRFAKASDVLISNGEPVVGWEPAFTFHGFRHVQVDGWSADDAQGPLSLNSVTALVLHTDMTRTGWFNCSNDLVNRLHENAVWSMRGNFVSIPTDCPQRDERLGWTGDIQVFSPSANFLFNTSSVLGGWLEDVAVEQLQDGGGVPPFVVPNVIGRDDESIEDEWLPSMANAVWDDVVIILPWDLYRAFGDSKILASQYASMKAWIEQGIDRGPDSLWNSDIWQLGDWLDPLAPPSEPGNGRTDGVLVADAYLVRITGIMSQVARILGYHDEFEQYERQHARIRTAFQDKYITPRGLLASDSQTALALAFVHDLFATAEQKSFAASRLIRAVRQAQFRVSTGFVGTPIILHALTRIGQTQYAYRMLYERRCPSWMYPVIMGATTIWERWDSMLPDGKINRGEMTSFNHYALGSVVNWLHEVVGGISPLSPGWKTIQVRVVPGGTLNQASVRHISPYGEIKCSWELEEIAFSMQLTVPPNSAAYVILPSRQRREATDDDEEGVWVGSGEHCFSCHVSQTTKWPLTSIRTPFWLQPPDETI